MKKLMVMLMVLCLAAGTMLAGCSSDSKDTGAGTAKEESGGEAAGDDAGDAADDSDDAGYVFKAGDTQIGADMDIEPIIEALGEPDSYFEEPSCAAEGIARLYGYGSYEIETYPDGEKNLVCRVTLLDDLVATPEGIDLSMTKDDIIKTYGEDYTESGTGMVYEKGGMKLTFIMDGDNIKSIEYTSAVWD